MQPSRQRLRRAETLALYALQRRAVGEESLSNPLLRLCCSEEEEETASPDVVVKMLMSKQLTRVEGCRDATELRLCSS